MSPAINDVLILSQFCGKRANATFLLFSIGHDLAVMSLCNHTILTYGTFSHWAGFLAGGSRVLPMHFPEYRFGKKLVGKCTG